MTESRERKRERTHWEPDEKRNKAQYTLVQRITKLCGLFNNWKALVWFGRQSDPANREGIIPLHDLVVTSVTLENNGAWKRVLTLGAHVAHGHVLIGGGGFNPIDPEVEKGDDAAENGIEGWWRTRAGRYFLQNDLPDDYVVDAEPEGHFRDAGAHPRSRLSLFCNDPYHHQENARTRARLNMILREIEQTPDQNMTRLRAPTFLVGVGVGRVEMRAFDPRRTRSDVEAMDELTAECVALGSWAIPGHEHLFSPVDLHEDELGTVKDVKVDRVDAVSEAGAVITLKNPAMQIRKLIREATGYDAADLDVVPIVDREQQVSRESCLFGPVKAHSTGGQYLRNRKFEDDEARLRSNRLADVMGIWAVLTIGQKTGAQTLYPVEYVVPKSESRTFAVLIDSDGEPVGAQRISLSGPGALGAALAVKCAEPGVRINLRNTSVRAWLHNRRRDRREREHREGTEA